MVISGPADAELSVALVRGGWADVEFCNGLDEAGMLSASGIESAVAFRVQLDQWVPCLFGNDFAARPGDTSD